MTEKQLAELKALAEADDPAAMFIYSEAIRSVNPQLADKYIVLAAVRGNPQAAERLGDRYREIGDMGRATYYYKTGAKGGVLDCAVKLAVLNLDYDEHAAMRELEELAENGVKSACAALVAYYKSKGNRKEAAFWQSLMK